MERLRYMLENQVGVDVTFRIQLPDSESEPVDIRAHKTILIMASEVFEAMFNERWVDGERPYIEITDILAADFREFLKFVYYKEVQLNQTNAFGILYAAKKYCVTDLVKKCQDFLKNGINSRNACQTLDQALSLEGEEELAKASMKFIRSNAEDIMNSEGFLSLRHGTLLLIVKDERLNVSSEKKVYNACIKWAMAQQEPGVEATREQIRETLGEIFYSIRFPVMEMGELLAIAQDTDILSMEEKVNIYEHILGRNTTRARNTRFPANSRNLYDYATANRMPMKRVIDKPGMISPGNTWQFEGTARNFGAIVSVNKETKLSAFGVLQCSDQYRWQDARLSIEITDMNHSGITTGMAWTELNVTSTNLDHTIYSDTYECVKITKVSLTRPFKLTANRMYCIRMRGDRPLGRAWYPMQRFAGAFSWRQEEIQAQGVGLQVTFSPIHDLAVMDVDYLEIPMLYFESDV